MIPGSPEWKEAVERYLNDKFFHVFVDEIAKLLFTKKFTRETIVSAFGLAEYQAVTMEIRARNG